MDEQKKINGSEENSTQLSNEIDSGPTGANLLELASEKVKEKESSNDDELSEEKNVIFVGGHDSGKSTIILRFTDRNNEVAKPTIALDYTFCRKAKSGSSVLKHIGHIWELGEGTFLMKLIDVVVNPENLLNTSVILTVDLSKLSEVWITLETIIVYLKQRIKESVKEINKANPKIKERLKNAIMERIGDNPDHAKLEPIALPTAIVATKYDIFETYEPEKQKIIAKSLRFVAHYFGASLVFSSYKNETTVSRLKTILNHFLLDGSFPNKQSQFDHLKPLFVPFGSDTFESIGLPPLSSSELNDPNHKTLLDLWRVLFCKHFPQEESKKDPTLLEDYGKDLQFEEPVIDTLKEQKMKELESLREVLNKRRSQSNQSIKIQIIN